MNVLQFARNLTRRQKRAPPMEEVAAVRDPALKDWEGAGSEADPIRALSSLPPFLRMEADAQVKSCLDTRKCAVLSGSWRGSGVRGWWDSITSPAAHFPEPGEEQGDELSRSGHEKHLTKARRSGAMKIALKKIRRGDLRMVANAYAHKEPIPLASGKNKSEQRAWEH